MKRIKYILLIIFIIVTATGLFTMLANKHNFNTEGITIIHGGGSKGFNITDPAIIKNIKEICENGEFRKVPREELLKGLCDNWIDFNNGTVIGLYSGEDYGNIENEIKETGRAKYLPEGLSEYVEELIRENSTT